MTQEPWSTGASDARNSATRCTPLQDVGGVDFEKFLLWMFAAALWRHARDRPLHDLEERLLHAFARNVAGNRGIVGLAGYLIDLVDVDDAPLRALDVVVGRLQQLENDVLDVLADIAGFGQRCASLA
jgi:hypothetical protein